MISSIEFILLNFIDNFFPTVINCSYHMPYICVYLSREIFKLKNKFSCQGTLDY